MAVTHTHHHETEAGEAHHVDGEGATFGALVHSKLSQGGAEHTHEEVEAVYDRLTDSWSFVRVKSGTSAAKTPPEQAEKPPAV